MLAVRAWTSIRRSNQHTLQPCIRRRGPVLPYELQKRAEKRGGVSLNCNGRREERKSHLRMNECIFLVRQALNAEESQSRLPVWLVQSRGG